MFNRQNDESTELIIRSNTLISLSKCSFKIPAFLLETYNCDGNKLTTTPNTYYVERNPADASYRKCVRIYEDNNVMFRAEKDEREFFIIIKLLYYIIIIITVYN